MAAGSILGLLRTTFYNSYCKQLVPWITFYIGRIKTTKESQKKFVCVFGANKKQNHRAKYIVYPNFLFLLKCHVVLFFQSLCLVERQYCITMVRPRFAVQEVKWSSSLELLLLNLFCLTLSLSINHPKILNKPLFVTNLQSIQYHI